MTELVRVDDLRCGYGRHAALEGVSFTAVAGQVTVLVGPNGSGKSTLIQALTSMRPAAYRVGLVDGNPLGSPGARDAASVAPDEPVYFSDLGVKEQLEYLASLGHESADIDGHVGSLVTALGLDPVCDDIPTRLSRGWRQRVSIACAMARATPLLCIDEPFIGLDGEGRDQLRVALGEYLAAGRTVIVATHAPAELGEFEPQVLSTESWAASR